MFMGYLGGGIGHLEQFPPANNEDNDGTMNDDGNAEVETDDFIAANDDAESDDDDNKDKEGDGYSKEDEDNEGAESEHTEGDDLDPGEWSDEETRNVYYHLHAGNKSQRYMIEVIPPL